MLEGDERTDSSLAAGVTWGRWKLFASTDPHLTGWSFTPGPWLLQSLSGSDFFVLVSAVFCLASDSLTGTGWSRAGWAELATQLPTPLVTWSLGHYWGLALSPQ